MLNEDRARQIALWLLIFLIGASALAFGSAELWAQEWLRFGGLVALTLVVLRVNPRDVFRGTAGRLALPVALLIVWGMVQAVPLPRSLVGLLSPHAVTVYEETVPPGGGESLPAWLVEKAREAGFEVVGDASIPVVPDHPARPTMGASLSLYPHATLRAGQSWLTAVVFFLLAAWTARSELARYRLLWAISAWTGLMGLIAVLQKIRWNDKLLWIRDVAPGTAPLGPFVNPNHYAGYVEMGLLVTLGLTLALLSQPTGNLDRAGIREAVLDKAWTLPRILLLGAFATLGFCGLLISGSRGGLVAVAAGLLFVVLAKRLRGALIIVVSAVVLAGIAVGLVNTLGLDVREAEVVPIATAEIDPSFALRLDTYAKTWEMFTDFPVTGTGLGTFQWAFAGYQRAGEWLTWAHAHNDYLQLLSEAGLVGGLVMAWALWVFIGRVMRPGISDISGRPRWTSVGTAAAVFAVLVHSMVDFNLQMPSNAVLFSVLVGILTAASGDDRSGSATA